MLSSHKRLSWECFFFTQYVSFENLHSNYIVISIIQKYVASKKKKFFKKICLLELKPQSNANKRNIIVRYKTENYTIAMGPVLFNPIQVKTKVSNGDEWFHDISLVFQ